MYGHSQNLSVTLFGNKIVADGFSQRSGDDIILDLGWALNSVTDVLTEKKRGWRDKEEVHVKTEAKAGMLQLKPRSSKDGQGLPKAGRGKAGFLSRTFFRGNMALLIC